MSAPVERGLALPQGGAWLRFLLALAAVGVLMICWRDTSVSALVFVQIAMASAMVVGVVWNPDSLWPAGLISLAIGIRLFDGAAVVDSDLLWLIVLIPLVHQLAAVAGAIPARAELSLAALLPSAMRYVTAVLVTVLLVLFVVVTGLAPFQSG